MSEATSARLDFGHSLRTEDLEINKKAQSAAKENHAFLVCPFRKNYERARLRQDRYRALRISLIYH